jgi:hypothetical protein
MNNYFIFSFLILFISFSIYLYFNLGATFYEKDLNSEQIELKPTTNTSVLTVDGKLSNIGWSKSNKWLKFNPNRINPSTSPFKLINKFRYKKWEAFVLTHDKFLMTIAAFDLGYLGGFMIHYGNTTQSGSKLIVKEKFNLLNRPKINDDCKANCTMVDSYKMGDEVFFQQIKFSDIQDLNIVANFSDIYLNLNLKLDTRNYDSLITLNPISEDSTLFYYNTKTYTIRASGTVILNGNKYDGREIYIANDSGRGVWPFQSGWYWVSINGRVTNSTSLIGINIGHGFNNPKTSKFTEDSFFIDGKIYKLGAVKTSSEVHEEDGTKYIKWLLESVNGDNRCNLLGKTIKSDKLGRDYYIARIMFNLSYVLFSGECKDMNGKVYKFNNLLGLIEEKFSIW